ncbi:MULTISPECIES: ATP-binding cassette domain-containing protein [Sphingomonadales]|jgi:ABC-2 type transport system ATP-binding protein|uniref:ABC transporter multidrug efflux pump n=2 Tax=Sphingomonadaceae TaxID=41297 RepID=A0A292ZB18_SPHSA|nr:MULTISPECIES: ATP-binding cassette domain-containing protein [Sphingomonadaceae]ARR52978.1 multidrug ABC transporter ATP-binding protein [Rhizorhabdus wittichii DC-6]PJG48468.1 multidrug ABC transporter ATP-binding protein [Sphingobium sp. LB126]QTH24380.1 ABC transporter ATP-binding protein [Rhizorhabdus wittichii]QUM73080.1 ABC transporter ATP-binding protein [Sphingopyxis granuli]GAY20044.1 ABC transporter multidrug efflux pump [Sphingobium fuliginis]
MASGSAASDPPPAPLDEVAVVIDGVSKHFGGVQALQDLNAQIRFGRLTGLVGPDGAGKTTLMRILTGLLAPNSGRATVAGFDVVDDNDAIHAATGYMPQRFGLYEDLSVMENMRLYAQLRGMDADRNGELFSELLDFTRLAPFTGRLAGKLSGGMKQKLGLACALMARPAVLLLDEPSVGVDPVSRQELWRMVQALTDEGMAVVWSTAYLDEAERCDSVLLLNEGRLAYDGPPGELTGRLAGRSFRLEQVGDQRRAVLAEALDLSSVGDGVIQGSGVRIVLRPGAGTGQISALADRIAAQLKPVPARFEDSFIDLLGGGPGGTSALAEGLPPIRLESDIAVSCRNLTKRFGDFTATDNISFEVGKGEIFGLLGPNGAGKSTTFKMLCGLLKPTSGEAHVAGLDLRRATGAVKGQLGYMAQKFSLYGLLSVRQNLEFSAGVYGLDGATQRARIEEMIEIFGLQPWLSSAPDSLPLGYKQRLALACAVMHRPPVLFLDEPTSGVDPITRREFWTHINGLARKGVTVMVTTHFMDEAEYCDRVAMLYRARLIALDTPDALKRGAASDARPDPTMEDAFIHLVEAEDLADVARSEVAA